DIEQDSTPHNGLHACRIAVHRAVRAWWRRVIVHTIFPVNVGERVEMRAGMVVHDGKTGRTLELRTTEFPRLGHTIVPIALLNDLWAKTRWSDNAGHIAVHFLTQRIHFPLLNQAARFDNHVRGDDVDHAALVFLTPAPPVPP